MSRKIVPSPLIVRPHFSGNSIAFSLHCPHFTARLISSLGHIVSVPLIPFILINFFLIFWHYCKKDVV